MSTTMHSPGALALVVGPSGAGKDTLIAHAARALAGEPWVRFPRRVVTRPADAGGEDHIAATMEDFDAGAASGAFCLAWRAHGLRYGIPRESLDAVRTGCIVVVNVSRGVVAAAAALGVPVVALHVTAKPETRAARLAHRGRERAEDVAARLVREAPFEARGIELVEIDNDSDLETAAAAMIDAIRRLQPAAGSAREFETGSSQLPA